MIVLIMLIILVMLTVRTLVERVVLDVPPFSRSLASCCEMVFVKINIWFRGYLRAEDRDQFFVLGQTR